MVSYLYMTIKEPQKPGRKPWVSRKITVNLTEKNGELLDRLVVRMQASDTRITQTDVINDALAALGREMGVN